MQENPKIHKKQMLKTAKKLYKLTNYMGTIHKFKVILE